MYRAVDLTYFTLARLFPVIEPGMSDSGCVDNAVEFLVLAGKRSLPEVKENIDS